MATGSGKTIVIAMVIAWHVLNKVTAPQDARFTKNVLGIAPGLTVKSRLAVLESAGIGNYYEAFNIVPSALLDKLRQGKVLVRNWHALAWESEEQVKKRRSVDKRGVKSDDAEEEDAPVERKLAQAEQAELLRRTVDTVGKAGQPGEKVISVGMLSEGWDRQDGDPHHGAEGLHLTASVRAGGGAWAAAHFLRGQFRNGAVRAGVC
jgi:hypothetical protein